jgi:hypothetical protein
MAVRCGGDSRAMEQIGEKQELESALSRLGFAHEAFLLHVRHTSAPGAASGTHSTYAVCVTNTVNKRRNIYWGGPGKLWIPEFVTDLAGGLYGLPDGQAHGASPPRKPGRLRLVPGGTTKRR